MLYNNFFSQVWYTPISERDQLVPTRFLLKPLSYKTYSSIYSRQLLPDGVEKDLFHDIILQESIMEVDNLQLDSSIPIGAQLPSEIFNELITTILNLYTPDSDFYKTLNLSLDIAVNPRFSGETWDCTICQSKKLHFQRNCYLVPEEEHDETFGVPVLGEIIRTCPINLKDDIIVDAAFSGRNMKESGCLPEVGGIGDQTVFFAIASQKAHSTIEYYKNKQAEEQANKSKRG